MLRDHRVNLTKDVMSRVIPTFLRQGFRIIVNAWASTQENHGKIETREVNPDPALLQLLLGVSDTVQAAGADAADASDAAAQLQNYLNTHVFDILQPKGRTDLYGSCFQLLQQCQDLQGGGPVYAFVLTDGEHNKLDCPVHLPKVEGEDYFGVYTATAAATKGKLKFTRNGVEPSVPLCERFLRRQLDSLNASADAGAGRVSITLIGIGK
jgi:hypothetical protein